MNSVNARYVISTLYMNHEICKEKVFVFYGTTL